MGMSRTNSNAARIEPWRDKQTSEWEWRNQTKGEQELNRTEFSKIIQSALLSVCAAWRFSSSIRLARRVIVCIFHIHVLRTYVRGIHIGARRYSPCWHKTWTKKIPRPRTLSPSMGGAVHAFNWLSTKNERFSEREIEWNEWKECMFECAICLLLDRDTMSN